MFGYSNNTFKLLLLNITFIIIPLHYLYSWTVLWNNNMFEFKDFKNVILSDSILNGVKNHIDHVKNYISAHSKYGSTALRYRDS